MDVFDLYAKIALDTSEYENGIGKAKGGLAGFAKSVGRGLKTVAKVSGVAIAAGAAGVAALTKLGTAGYAEYEQLVGGVETLFKTSQNAVMAYAQGAYKTAGMSANEYMNTITSFSASLIQSLGGDTKRAAEIGNMAITDMSDNANKMGTSSEMIQNAYQGFAKQNYTMLDNLKLGYGGTKAEMERLLKDAEKLSGVKYDISSFADVAEAIHVVQTEMGITGTTAREAAATISGSVGMAKAAWKNLVVGMADDNQNFNKLMDDFVGSADTAAKNLLPRIETTLKGVGKLIEGMAPVISEALPMLVEAAGPSLLSAGVNIVLALGRGIAAAAPAILDAALSAIYMVLTQVFGMSEKSAGKFVDGMRLALGAIVEGFKNMVTEIQTEGTFLNTVFSGIQEITSSLWDFCVAAFEAISTAFHWVAERANADGTYINTVWENIQTVVGAAISIIQGIIQTFTAILQGDWSTAWENVQTIAFTASEAVHTVITNIITYLTEFMGDMVSKGIELIASLADGIQQKFAELYTLVGGWVNDNIIDPLESKFPDLVSSGRKAINNLWEGMKAAWDSVVSWFEGVWDSLVGNLTVNVSANVHEGGGGKFATGLNYVPYDNFPAFLHRGEAVLTAPEARVWRNGGSPAPAAAGTGGGITIIQNINVVPQTPAEFAAATEAYFEQARWML